MAAPSGHSLDDADVALLNLLQADARQPAFELSFMITCTARIGQRGNVAQ